MERQGVRVVVVSSGVGEGAVADELKRQADEFVELAEITDTVWMDGRSA